MSDPPPSAKLPPKRGATPVALVAVIGALFVVIAVAAWVFLN